MNPTNQEQATARRFDSFCKKVLTNEARNYHNEMKRQRINEVSFSELSERELGELATTDAYFATEQIFDVLGSEVVVYDDMIAEALQSLPTQKRDIILLSYFLELSDGEIAKKLDLIRSTVQYRRKSTLQELKKIIKEGNANE